MYNLSQTFLLETGLINYASIPKFWLPKASCRIFYEISQQLLRDPQRRVQLTLERGGKVKEQFMNSNDPWRRMKIKVDFQPTRSHYPLEFSMFDVISHDA